MQHVCLPSYVAVLFLTQNYVNEGLSECKKQAYYLTQQQGGSLGFHFLLLF